MKIKTVTCRSGIKGWQAKLQDVYTSYSEFEIYATNFNLAKRLGYKSAKTAWEANPTIQGSVIIGDYRKVRTD